MQPEKTQARQTFAQFSNLSGSSYEIGQQIGMRIKQHPAALQAMLMPAAAINQIESKQQLSLFRQYFPNQLEEMQGTADEIKTPVEQLAYLSASYLRGGNCCHFILPGRIMQNQQDILARSYEFSESMDDMNISRISSPGVYTHMGSAMMWHGRYDGINEKGLAVTMSAGGLPVSSLEGLLPPIQDGFQFWTLIRAVLETCQTVQQGIDLIKDVPLCGNPILMLLDAAGDQARVEVLGNQIAVKSIRAEDEEFPLAATNHFQDLSAPKVPVFKQSHTRLKTIEDFQNSKNKFTLQDVQTFLDMLYPQGVSCNYYQEFFGTLRSMIFNPKEKSLQVRFGTPGLNEWKTLSLLDDFQESFFPVNLKDEIAAPEFWAKA